MRFRASHALAPTCAGLVVALGLLGPAPRSATASETLPIRGVVRPADQAALTSDLQAMVARVAFKEGERFRRGDVLVEFDCRRLEAELASAEAQETEARIQLENSQYLAAQKAGGKLDVEVARARLAKAAAESEAQRIRMDGCRIVAPYDGRIAELAVHAHEVPQPGRPMLAIIDDSRLELELIVPSETLAWLKAGTTFGFRVDELGRSYEAQVTRLGAMVDPVSQTAKVMGVLDGEHTGVLPGMSGEATLTRPEG